MRLSSRRTSDLPHEHVNIDADHERTYQTLPNLRALLTSLTE
jgi:hypothetical protein